MEFWYEVPFIVSYFNVEGAQSIGVAYHEYIIDLKERRATSTKEILEAGIKRGQDPDDIIIESENYEIYVGAF